MQTDRIPLHQLLFQKYYDANDSARINNEVTSSHWKEFSGKIKVTRTIHNGQQDYTLSGYGFGDNARTNLINKIFNVTSELINRVTLNIPELAIDLSRSKALIRKMGFTFSQDAFRQVCTLNLIKKQLSLSGDPRQILIIGDGHGILAALLHDAYPSANIFLADLGPMLFFQSYNLHKLFPNATQKLADGGSPADAVFHFCSADDLTALSGSQPDLAVNIASMQEMDKKIIDEYFSLMRQLGTKAFYCCNRLEKKMPDGETTKFMEYPWKMSDVHLVDELCSWHRWFIKYVRNGQAAHVKFAGLPIPFVHLYDGPHWHRFTLLSN